MRMTLEEMKLAVAGMLPELISLSYHRPVWKGKSGYSLSPFGSYIHWPAEGLQVCHEAEKLLPEWKIEGDRYSGSKNNYRDTLHQISKDVMCATYEQKLEALCRTFFPERFQP